MTTKPPDVGKAYEDGYNYAGIIIANLDAGLQRIIEQEEIEFTPKERAMILFDGYREFWVSITRPQRPTFNIDWKTFMGKEGP